MSVSLEKVRAELADLAETTNAGGSAPELARRILAALPESGIVLSAEEVERLLRFHDWREIRKQPDGSWKHTDCDMCAALANPAAEAAE